MATIQNIYGVTSNGVHTDVSTSLRYTKQYATKNGYNQISIRYNGGYNAEIIAHKLNGVWQKCGEQK